MKSLQHIVIKDPNVKDKNKNVNTKIIIEENLSICELMKYSGYPLFTDDLHLIVLAEHRSPHYSISLLILGVIHDNLNVGQSDGYIRIVQCFNLYSVNHHWGWHFFHLFLLASVEYLSLQVDVFGSFLFWIICLLGFRWFERLMYCEH